MADEITIEDINKILDLATLHGRMENWVFQTSKSGSQQIKIVTSESYLHNLLNTALRIRARRIMSYAMKLYNPALDSNFSNSIKELYLNTIYLFFISTVKVKAKYLKITTRGYYVIYRSDQPDPIYSGYIDPDQSISFEVPTASEFALTCYQNDEFLHSIDIKVVDEMFDITKFYNKLFGLENYFIPEFFLPDGFVIISNTLFISGTLIET